MHPRAFYCVCDSRYFVGTVALINSLRLVGHDEPIVVLDTGLEVNERALLAREATVLACSQGVHAGLAKWEAPLRLPATEAIVLVDADVVTLRPLTPLLERAAEGDVVAFLDDQPDRFHPEWRSHLGAGELTRHPYVNMGLLVLPGQHAPELLGRVRDLQQRLDLSRSRGFGGGSMADPFHLADQDSWNAVLAGGVPQGRLVSLDHALAPFQPWERARLDDPVTLRCSVSGGLVPYVLHHIGPKPWLQTLPRSAYSDLLPRLLHAPDVALRLGADVLPFRLRRRPMARIWHWASLKTKYRRAAA